MQTTLNDFAATCAVADGAFATHGGDGALRLSGAFADAFDGSSLNATLWATGTWNGGSFAPTPSGTVALNGPNGAWLRSQSTFTRQTLEARVTFGAAPWQHVGLGSNEFESNRYLIFSTAGTTDRLYARSNNNDTEWRTDLGPLPTGPVHLRIEWTTLNATTDQIRFFLDGALVATHEAPAMSNLYTYLSHNGQGATPPLTADYVDITPAYNGSGSYTSCALDAGQTASWTQLQLTSDILTNTTLNVEAHTSSDGTNWSAWENVGANGSVSAPDGRFLQYRLNLGTSNTQISPLIHTVTATYQ
jgi:hypothetical protein